MIVRKATLMAALASFFASPAEATWREAKSKHFVIYSEQSANELTRFAERLERFDNAVRRLRGMDDPPLTDGAKVTIYVLPNAVALQKLHGGAGARNVLGFYLARASGSVAFVASSLNERIDGLGSEHVFQHEYVHHLMLTEDGAPLASWLIEGAAEFFGTAEVQKDGSVKMGLPPQVRGYEILSDSGFNAEQLLSQATPRNDEDRSSLYGKGWLLTHYLTFNPERRKQLGAYVTAMAKGEPGLTAARSAFGDLKTLDREMDRYARGTFQGVLISPGPAPEVTIRTLSEGEDAIMPVRIRSDRGVNAKVAAAVAADARRIAVRFPADPFVQATLAEAEFDVEDYPAAIAAADRALKADPRNVQAMIYRGRALMAGARAGDKSDPLWKEARSWFVRANKADTENAEPLMRFYRSYLLAGEEPTASAIAGLAYARLLAPQDRALRFDAVRQLLIDGKVKEAEMIFAPLAFDPHLSAAARPRLTEAMERIRAGDGKGALAVLEANGSKDSSNDADD